MSSPVRVKICGLTRPEDAVLATQAGADAIGLVFYPPSPRYLGDFTLAEEIAQSVGPFVNVVGLFVDANTAHIESCLERVSLHLLQFHGSEAEDFCLQFQRPYIKALAMKDGVDITKALNIYTSASAILFDTYRPGIPGGTGETFNWNQMPANSHSPVVLAGGLKPSNVADAIRQVRPYAVDVSGGVESSVGIKDAHKVAEFIRCAKAV